MAKYIDREAFLAQERAWYCDQCDRRKNSKGKTVYEIGEAPCRSCDIGDVLDLLEDYPAADVVERKTGEWKKFNGYAGGIADDGTHISLKMHKCSACGKASIDAFYDNFCPNCGADMRGDEH